MIDKAEPIFKENVNEGFDIRFKNSSLGNIKAKWIIDATGRKSAIARKFSLHRKRADMQMSAISWISTPVTDDDHATRIKSVPDGWWYTSLLPEQSSDCTTSALYL
ncbi:MAG: hypothetical protein EOO38_24995 [Cytophagaceae bacterium]|nr:MAG: hypothetical protein EOO38_24995 [Cytophagaceae bacterium]